MLHVSSATEVQKFYLLFTAKHVYVIYAPSLKQMETSFNKKAVLSQGNRAMLQLFFSV